MNAKELLKKYAKEWEEYKETSSAREVDCMESLLDDGIFDNKEEFFLKHIVSPENVKRIMAGEKPFNKIQPKERQFIILTSDDWRIFENGVWREMTAEEQIESSK